MPARIPLSGMTIPVPFLGLLLCPSRKKLLRTSQMASKSQASSHIKDPIISVLIIFCIGRRRTRAIVKPLVRAWTMGDEDPDEDSGYTTIDPRTHTHYTPSASCAPTPSLALETLFTSTPTFPVKSSSCSKSKKKTKSKGKAETTKVEVKTDKKDASAPARIFEKCDCALQDGGFEPSSWDEFKIPVSCRPRPILHFFRPRDSDMAKPTTRFVVDNINAFRHHSTKPNIPYVNEDIEAMFYFTGAKNVRCFDGRVVDGIVRYSVSYAVVDFDTVEDAIAVFRTFRGRKDYPDSFHLRLEFVDREDKTFGGRLSRAMGPTKRSEEKKKWFADFVEDMGRVDVDLAKVPAPRHDFALPPRPISPVG